MSKRAKEGGGGAEVKELSFLSTHRCPEVEHLRHHSTASSKHLIAGGAQESFSAPKEADYLEVYSSCYSSSRPSLEEEEEKEGSISDWSEEDLSLHFSPSVILPSENEESDSESGFQCVDVALDHQVKGHEGEQLKMVPKRQIQLKRRNSEGNLKPASEDSEVRQKNVEDGFCRVGGVKGEASANEQLYPSTCHRPELLLRQHSMPASFQHCSVFMSEADGYRGQRAAVAASQVSHTGSGGDFNPRQCLQKSFSLDETKTKMASCIIKNVLSKKMQVEQSVKESAGHTHTTNPAPLSRRGEQGPTEPGKVGGVMVVRDIRSQLKSTPSLSFRNTNPAPTAPQHSRISRFPSTMYKVIGQGNSPPPSYQQAVGVKGHEEVVVARRGSQSSPQPLLCAAASKGYVAKVAAAFHQSQERRESSKSSKSTHQVTQQRGGSQPILTQNESESNQNWPTVSADLPTEATIPSQLSKPSQSEIGGGSSSVEIKGSTPTLFSNQAPPSSSSPAHMPPVSQSQSSLLTFSAPSAPTCLLPSYLYSPFPHSMHAPLGRLNFIQGPVSFVQAAPFPQTLTSSLANQAARNQLEEEQSGATASFQPDGYKGFIKYSPLHQNTGDPSSGSHADKLTFTRTPQTQQPEGPQEQRHHHHHHHYHQPQQQHQQQEQQPQPQPLLQPVVCSLEGFLPPQTGAELQQERMGLVDMSIASGKLYNSPTHHHMLLDPQSGRCFYMDTLPQPQTKMLFDPETGSYLQVLLPPANPAPHTALLPVSCATLPYQPPHLAIPALYNPHCLHLPPPKHTHH